MLCCLYIYCNFTVHTVHARVQHPPKLHVQSPLHVSPAVVSFTPMLPSWLPSGSRPFVRNASQHRGCAYTSSSTSPYLHMSLERVRHNLHVRLASLLPLPSPPSFSASTPPDNMLFQGLACDTSHRPSADGTLANTAVVPEGVERAMNFSSTLHTRWATESGEECARVKVERNIMA
ncbi:hypothetical protein DM02DRAFT_237080 [Periconia macrospinosa]|uniref:Uncharacterized protein n=1 Tax=Periconia macrospinosa TaxID=97972 RepID=A0A2V1EBN9_9PLEO|nr:hypothetical protein DM02DRAFT_237080 [Periconia macrospinosa]